MDVRIDRLRRGEIVAGACGGALLAFSFTLTRDGRRLTGVRLLVVMAAVAGLALAAVQAACRAPALPVSVGVIVMALGMLAVAALALRALRGRAAPGALAAAAGLVLGGMWSLRQEDGWVPDAEHPVERVPLPSAT